MKKSLPLSTSILTLCLIALTVFSVSMQRGAANGSPQEKVAPQQGAATASPTAGNQVKSPLVGPVTVTATAGTVGPTDYATLKLAFDAINAGTHQGAITIDIVSSTTEGTTPATLNSSGAGSASYTSVLIRPSTDGVSISGNPASGFGVVQLNGADNVTIDGDNPNTGGTNRNLTITNTAVSTTTYSSVIRIALSTLITTADNDTFKNLNLVGSATGRNVSSATSTTGSENTAYVILAGGGASTVSATTAPSAITSISTTIASPITAANLTVLNNSVIDASRGIATQGASTTVFSGLSITNNTIGNATAGAVDGIYALGILINGSANAVASGNTVYVEGYVPSSTSNQGIAVGTISSNTSGATIEKNKVNRVQANNTTGYDAYGINLAGGNNHIVRNNFVSGMADVPNSTFSTTFGVFGIRIATGTGHFIYHNSVNLYGNLTGATGAALSAALGIVSTASTGMDIRNNILANSQSETGATTPASSAFVSLYLPSGGTSAMNLTLNNNDYYQGGTAAYNGIGQAGTTAGTGFYTAANFNAGATTPATNMRAYTSTLSAAGTNDNASKVVDPLFASSSDLHISGASTMIDMGVSVGVTTDIDMEARPNGAAPEIGADEFYAQPGTIQFSSATYTATEASLSATITVTRTGGSSGAAQVDYATVAGGSAMGGASCGAGVDYVTSSGTLMWANNDSAPKTFTVTVCNDGVTEPSETVNLMLSNVMTATLGSPSAATLTIVDSNFYSGSINVGAAQAFTSLTNPGGIFEAINNGGLSGSTVINITSDLTGETGAIALNQWLEQGPGGYTVTIQPSGAARSVTGSANGALIKFNGASRVTVDGSIGGGGTDRSLTIENTSVTTPNVVVFGSIGTTPITSDTLKNCVVRNGVNTSSAVVISDATTVGNTGYFSNVTVQNNNIQKAYIGVYATGGTTPQNGSNLTYTQNALNTSGANAIRDVGLYMQGVNGATVSQNTVGNFNNADGENDVGIWLASGTINATVSNNTVATLGYTGTSSFAPIGINVTSGATGTSNIVTGNSVSDISSNGTTAVRGISVSGATTGDMTVQGNNVQGVVNTSTSTYGAYGLDISGGNNIVVRNNFVSNVNHDMTGGTAFSTTFGVLGIRVGSGTGILVYHNSVNLYGAFTGTATTSLLSAAFALVSTSSTGCDVRNNVFANTLTGGTTSVAHVSVCLPSGATSALNLTWNNNAYYNGTDAARQGLAQVGTTAGTGFYLTSDFNPGATTPATNFRAYSSTLSVAGTNDNASQASTSAAPFISNNDLHITSSNPLLSAGATIASVTNDYDNDPRPASNPDIGADELVQAVAGTIPAGTFYNALTADGDSLGGNVSITNIIYLNGKLSTGANTLGIGCNATISGGGASNYVIGNLKKTFCAAGMFNFVVGTANGFSPVAVNVTAGTFPADFTAKAVQGPQPNIADTTKALQRYWTLTATGVTADLTFSYLDPPDVPGTATEANFVIFKYSGGFSMPGGTVDTNANTASITGVTSFSDWTLAEPGAQCSFMLSPTSQNFAAAGGMNSVNVTAGTGCAWTAVSNDAFITVNSGTPGSGNGTVGYTVAANTGPARMGTMTIAGITFTVTQNSGCTFMLSPTSQNFVAAGGMNSVGVTAGAGCAWTAVSNNAFITVNSGTPGSGNGTVGYTVAANTGLARMGTMTIAGITFTVTQDSGCTFMLSPTSQNFTAPGGTNTVSVTQTTSCSWTAVSNDAFIIVDSGTPGSGNGTVGYHVTANTGPARTGTMTIAGITFTVTQDAACAFMLSSTSQSFSNAGGMDSVGVITGAGCTWTAVSNNAFITVNSGTPGTGNGTVGYTVAANVGPARMGTMTIAGITFTVNQAGGCMFTLSRDHQSFAGNGGPGSVNVIASDSGCPWTASTTATYIHITSGTPGTGNGTLQYTVDANAGATIRSDTITIAGQTYTVYQGIDFADVPSNDLFYTDIGKLAARGVTVGCGGGNYCPNQFVARDQMAAFIMRAKGEFNPPTPASQRFTDVPPSNTFYNFIDRLAVLGITVGCTPDHLQYCPGSPVPREQMSAFLLRGLGEFNPPTPASQRFTDVPPSNVFYNFIDRLAVLQITLGCTPDHLQFCPSDSVTRAQMAAFLVRAFDL
jgi:hypothetical protein